MSKSGGLLTGITSARLITLEDIFQRRTGGTFALLNKDVTNDPQVFRALRELGLAHTEAEQDVAMANLIGLVNGETDQETDQKTDQMDLAA